MPRFWIRKLLLCCAVLPGVLYPALAYFEYLTTRHASGKPSATCKQVLLGRPNRTLGTWTKNNLRARGAVTAHRTHTRMLREWYQFTVGDVGIQPLPDDRPGAKS